MEDINTTKYRCIGYHCEGKSITEIAGLLQKSYMTIKRWVEKFKVTGDLIKHKPRSGRPTKFTPRVEASIKRMIHEDASLTYKQVSIKLRGVKRVSKTAVAKYLKRKGSKYLPHNEAILSYANKQKRLTFAHEYLNGNLSNIIFSDESKFDLNRNKRRFYKFKGEKSRPRIHFNPNYSIMVWGAVSSKGKISLCEVPGRLNQTSYLNLLKDNLLHQANDKHGEGRWIFQQDNAPCHKARTVMKWFEDNNIPLVTHPPQSPDLNPIETVWSFLKRRVEAENPYSMQTLREAIFKAWKQVGKRVIAKTIRHLKTVCQGVIANNGNYLN